MKNSAFNIQNSLIAKKLITEEDIKTLQQKYKDDDDINLEQALMKENMVSEEDIYRTVSERFKMEMVDLTTLQIPEEVYDVIPQALVEDYGIAPIKEEDGKLVVATSNPADYRMIQVVSNNTKKRVRMVVATPTQIKAQQEKMFSSNQQEKMYDEAQEFIKQQMAASEDNVREDDSGAEDQPIIQAC